jgi:putative pre-16S rRNA nuclease
VRREPELTKRARVSLSIPHPLPLTPYPRTGTVLAFDFGTKRIGVAVGDFETRLAHPLTTIAHADNRARFGAIGRLIAEWHPVLLVIGLPEHADGSPHPVAQLAGRFAQRLRGRFGIATAYVDERLSSDDAGRALRAAGTHGKRLKAALDPVAAQRILETFFESTRESGRSGDREIEEKHG